MVRLPYRCSAVSLPSYLISIRCTAFHIEFLCCWQDVKWVWRLWSLQKFFEVRFAVPFLRFFFLPYLSQVFMAYCILETGS